MSEDPNLKNKWYIFLNKCLLLPATLKELSNNSNAKQFILKGILESTEENYPKAFFIIKVIPMNILTTILTPEVSSRILAMIIRIKDKMDIEQHINSIFSITKICGLPNGKHYLMGNKSIIQYLQECMHRSDIADYAVKVFYIILKNSNLY